jgi:ketosteroid isomerase-like protein
MGDAIRFMKPVNVFPSVQTILHWLSWLRKSLVAYRRFAMLQVIRPHNLRMARTAGAALLPPAVAIISVGLVPTICAAPTQITNAAAQIQSVLHAQQDAWNRGDIDGFMNGYARSSSTVFISQDELRRGWEPVRERYRQKYSDRTKMGALTFSEIEITLLSSEAAVVLGRWSLKRANDEPHGRFTLIFKRVPEGWRIVHDHTSAAPP